MSEYSHPLLNEEGKVICQICGKAYLIISPRHLGTHKITFSEYKLRFPDAPISCEEFNAMGKYGKEKNIFVKDELEKIEKDDEVEIQEIDIDIPEHDVEPVVAEEINFQEVADSAKPKVEDACSIAKDKILDHLRAFFTNIKKDYMIRILLLNGDLIFESITDFADPILKIDIEFPNTFWHNRMAHDDLNRNLKLKEYGWKVIKIESKAPSFKDISKAVNSL